MPRSKLPKDENGKRITSTGNVGGGAPGQNKLEVNWHLVKRLCHVQNTMGDIAAILEVSTDTLQARCQEEFEMTFGEYTAPWYAVGKASLRKKQWEKAMKGDKGMQIFLGKNMLGQKDNQDFDVSGNINVVIKGDDAKL